MQTADRNADHRTANTALRLAVVACLVLVVAWPLARRFEAGEWTMAYEHCLDQVRRNERLFGPTAAICDRGPNELAHRHTVDCEGARRIRSRGVYGCALHRRLHDHWITAAALALWHSWYTWGIMGLVAWFMGRQWWDHRTRLAMRDADTRIFSQLAGRMATANAGSLPPLDDRRLVGDGGRRDMSTSSRRFH